MAQAPSAQQRDLEPQVHAVLERRARRKQFPAYRSRTDAEVEAALNSFLAEVSPGARASGLARMGGGASKEQFVFAIEGNDGRAERHVLRMEPTQSISESDRRREFEILKAFQGIVPAPSPVWLDAEGAHLGQPSAIMKFVSGTTKPRDTGAGVSGLGTTIGGDLRIAIASQFIDHLVSIHAFDWRKAELPSFTAPNADPWQAARWQVNWWSQVWREDRVQSIPVVALAERWMRANLPTCDDHVLVHGDYRTGNYLFDEDAKRITAILDWELCHIGDPHEDLAWALLRLFGTIDGDRHLASGLFTREEFLTRYEAASGRIVNRKTLRFYEVFATYKCIVITVATGLRSAADQHNHQDILLTWLSAVGHIFLSEICDLMGEDL